MDFSKEQETEDDGENANGVETEEEMPYSGVVQHGRRGLVADLSGGVILLCGVMERAESGAFYRRLESGGCGAAVCAPRRCERWRWSGAHGGTPAKAV